MYLFFGTGVGGATLTVKDRALLLFLRLDERRALLPREFHFF